MTAIEKLNAYCESKGWEPVGDPRLLLEVLDNGKLIHEESSRRRWWNDLTRIVEVDGTLYEYMGAETAGDDSLSDKGWEFDPGSIRFVKATKTKELVAKLSFEASDSPCSLEPDAPPAAAPESGNHPDLVTPMPFGVALDCLKEGKRIARAGWNGKGIFIELQTPDENSKMTSPYIFIDTTGLQTDNPQSPKSRVPWLASQTDMLAEDWQIVD